jgi:hypothetical protein
MRPAVQVDWQAFLSQGITGRGEPFDGDSYEIRRF